MRIYQNFGIKHVSAFQLETKRTIDSILTLGVAVTVAAKQSSFPVPAKFSIKFPASRQHGKTLGN